ncbi:putative myosin heavy chain [Trypanosoma conorhini]|uniref:Putative myosin heavy chain n=1 Tax=Trypanosoma conorhini TaxID=83891 RepID=A0A422PH30_9TRYP|nr:putative myosin heavy chain [Trypanosoma conorhini]RNF17024.1 putative myosin heavy chain [Trypanosoma conorhini]
MAGVSLTSHEGYHVGDAVYFNHPTECWVRGTLTTIIRVTKKDGFTHVLYGCSAVVSARYLPSLSENPSLVHVYPLQQQDVHHIIESCVEPTEHNTLNDLLDLSYLHDATLLEQVRVRYYENLIYTHIGPITLALNPYDFTLPNYTDNNMAKYVMEGPKVIDAPSKNLPHAWTVAHYSYWRMCSDKRNQSVIVSGESGAGKTETAKIVVKYIGVVSTAQCSLQEKSGAEELTHKVNLTSPILEAFGNAKTKKNDNSSRFGKFMKVFFKQSPTGGVMTGASITVYLLERSRIVTHSKGERGYHSFYQLLASNGDAVKNRRLNKLQLSCAEDYRCTAVGNATTIEGVNDAKDFEDVMRAMEFVGMTEAECNAVWNTVGAVLHLLSLEFKALTDDECCVDMTAQNTAVHVRMAKELLGLPDDTFFKELVTTTQLTRGETIVRKLRVAQALDLCEGIAKVLYEALFLWLVGRINELIKSPSEDEREEMPWIGLLDIFGFENFSNGNSFEQLCINLANEALQNHYNSIVFTRDIEECHKEGINTEGVVFYDNQPCMDLICGVDFSGCGPGGSSRTTNKMSILHLLDEESSLAKGSDLAFREKVCDAYGGRLLDGKGGHPNFLRVKTDRSSFVVRHYAGNVTYNVEGFRAKNCDATKQTLKDAICSSTIPFVASLLDRKASGAGMAGKATVSAFFKKQLVQLMTELNGTHPHWIRCIKPHVSKKPRMFNGCEVMTQMRSAGVLETIKIRQNSFSVRLPFADFLRAHKVLTLELHPSVLAFCRSLSVTLAGFQAPFPANASEGEMVREILRRAGSDSNSQGQVGRTKVFLRMETSQHLASIVRTAQKGCLLMIQAATRWTSSCGTAHRKYLRHQLQLVAAALRSICSQLWMRRMELRQKENYFLTVFRWILLVQNAEAERRSCLEEEEGTTHLLLLHSADKERDAITHLLLKRREEEDAAIQRALIIMESEARCALEKDGVVSLKCLYEAMGLIILEENARDDLELEETMERRSTLEHAQREMNRHLALWFVHVTEKQRLELLETEGAHRRRTTEEESTTFALLCGLHRLLLSETMARGFLLEEESDAFSDWRQGWDSEWLRMEKLWLARNCITGRRMILLLQKSEVEARRRVEYLYNHSVVELLEAAVQGEARALESERERLALEEEERRLLEEEAHFIANEEERRRFNAIREAAQQHWSNLLEEERLVKEIKRVEKANQTILAAKAELTREYTLLCRRKEIAGGRSSPMANKFRDMRELEEHRHHQKALSHKLATNQKLLLDMERNLMVFRSKTSLRPPSRQTPSLVQSTSSPQPREDISLHALQHVSVSGEGSLHLIHRMHLMKGLANSRARESSRMPGALTAANRLEVYRKSRERRKREASAAQITKTKAPSPCSDCAEREMRTRLTSAQRPPPVDYCLQRNPFEDDWAPAPPDADALYWVSTPQGERVPLLPVEKYNFSGPRDNDTNGCGCRDYRDPYLYCFAR